MTKQVVIIGAGGHAKVIIDLLQSQKQYQLVGCTDNSDSIRQICGITVLGGDAILPQLFAEGVKFAFIAIGENQLRSRLAKQVTHFGFTLINAIGQSAIISPTARLGVGVAIMEGAVVNAESAIADLAIINTNATVDHDCVIGHAAHVAPGATLAGCVTAGDFTFIGAGASVIPDKKIGTKATVGAGAVVINDINNGETCVGVPARCVNLVEF